MPVLFEGNTGRVFAVQDRVATGAIQLGNIGTEDGGISWQVHNSIITRIGVSAAGNYQFLHTIGNDVYVYTFGDRMGQVRISGLSFSTKCPSQTGFASSILNSAFGEPHGFERLFQWYSQNRLAARKAPVTVTIGRFTSFRGFVTALTGDVQDTLHRTIQFQMTVSLLPDAVQ